MLQVGEYKDEMYLHLLEREAMCRPHLYLIQQQPEINLRMRPLLLDFLMDVINKLRLSTSTFPLTVNIIDRYCSVRIVKKQHYQLLGLTALWIACKNLDSKYRIPSLSDLGTYCLNCYDKKLFLEMENHVLKLLKWQVHAPTCDAFIDMYIHSLALSLFLAGPRNQDRVCNDIKIVAVYICELIQFYPNIYFNYTAPKVALLAVTFACMICEVGERGFEVASFLSLVTTMSNVQLLSTADFETAFSLLINVLNCPPPSLKTKYFHDGSRFLHLMRLLIAFVRIHQAGGQGQPPVTRPTTGPYSPLLTASLTATLLSELLTATQLSELTTSLNASNMSDLLSGSDLTASPLSGMSPVVGTPRHSEGSTTPKYPATPTLLSISPKVADSGNYDHKRPLLTKAVSSCTGYPSEESRQTLPLPNRLPGNEQSLFGTKRPSPAESGPPQLKRSKSVTKATFYIL